MQVSYALESTSPATVLMSSSVSALCNSEARLDDALPDVPLPDACAQLDDPLLTRSSSLASSLHAQAHLLSFAAGSQQSTPYANGTNHGREGGPLGGAGPGPASGRSSLTGGCPSFGLGLSFGGDAGGSFEVRSRQASLDCSSGLVNLTDASPTCVCTVEVDSRVCPSSGVLAGGDAPARARAVPRVRPPAV